MIVIFGAHVQNYDIPSKFFHFLKSCFLEFSGGKRAKMTSNYQFQYVLLYISGTVDLIIKILIVISTGVFLYIFFKNATL